MVELSDAVNRNEMLNNQMNTIIFNKTIELTNATNRVQVLENQNKKLINELTQYDNKNIELNDRFVAIVTSHDDLMVTNNNLKEENDAMKTQINIMANHIKHLEDKHKIAVNIITNKDEIYNALEKEYQDVCNLMNVKDAYCNELETDILKLRQVLMTQLDNQIPNNLNETIGAEIVIENYIPQI
jgi:chromosome segregation ATPase